MYLKRVLVSQVLCNNIMKTDWKQICWIVSRLIVQSQSMFCILRMVSLHTGEKLQRKGQYIYAQRISQRQYATNQMFIVAHIASSESVAVAHWSFAIVVAHIASSEYSEQQITSTFFPVLVVSDFPFSGMIMTVCGSVS